MGQSMTLGDDPSLQKKLPLPFTVFDNEAGEYYEVSQKDGGLYQSQYAVDRGGKEIFRQSWKLAFVTGSGENGYSFLIHRDGYLFEAPLSYYSKSRVWSFSPGYERRNLAFTRPVISECVSCHSGRANPVYEKTALYRDPPFTELAVGCENCHGPGALHVAERRAGVALPHSGDTSIVNPARLSGWLSDNVCMKCHQGGDVRVEQPGRHAEDFRPGLPLGAVVAIFKAPLAPASAQSVLLEHYFSMTLSKCYRASAGRLRCTSCHDPHSEPAPPQAAAFYRARCLNCHRPADCKKAPAGDCISCHMPKRTVTTITHAALTDHRVILRPDEHYPPEAFEKSADPSTGLFLLTAPAGDKNSVPPITLFQAYAALLRQGRGEFAGRAKAALDALAVQRPRDPVVLSALGRRAMNAGTPESDENAIQDLANAIHNGSSSAEDSLLLAALYGRRKDQAAAIEVLKDGLRKNPYVREFPESLAAQYMLTGDYRQAQEVVLKGLERFPDDIALRVLRKKIDAASLGAE